VDKVFIYRSGVYINNTLTPTHEQGTRTHSTRAYPHPPHTHTHAKGPTTHIHTHTHTHNTHTPCLTRGLCPREFESRLPVLWKKSGGDVRSELATSCTPDVHLLFFCPRSPQEKKKESRQGGSNPRSTRDPHGNTKRQAPCKVCVWLLVGLVSALTTKNTRGGIRTRDLRETRLELTFFVSDRPSGALKKKKTAPGGTRTPNPQIRSLMGLCCTSEEKKTTSVGFEPTRA